MKPTHSDEVDWKALELVNLLVFDEESHFTEADRLELLKKDSTELLEIFRKEFSHYKESPL